MPGGTYGSSSTDLDVVGSSALRDHVADATLRIAVLSTVRPFRDGLVELLKKFASVDVATVQPGDTDGIVQLSTVEPSVILVPVFSREDVLLVRLALQLAPQARLIAVGVPDIDDVMVACAQAGVSGYVLAAATIDELTATIDAVIRNRPATPPSVAAALLRHVAKVDGSHLLVSSLTGREREILRCLREGLSNKEIAHRLDIESSTVKNHIHNLLQKL